MLSLLNHSKKTQLNELLVEWIVMHIISDVHTICLELFQQQQNNTKPMLYGAEQGPIF
jgi:hypothetical protein